MSVQQEVWRPIKGKRNGAPSPEYKPKAGKRSRPAALKLSNTLGELRLVQAEISQSACRRSSSRACPLHAGAFDTASKTDVT